MMNNRAGHRRHSRRDHGGDIDVKHRNRKLLDYDGQPVPTEDFSIPDLPLIEPAALPGLPDSMEGRLFAPGNGMEPCVVLFHPLAELHVLVRLTDLDRLQHHIDALNTAVLKQAMGVTPDDPLGYSTDSGLV
jgi:hypothetical protein